MDEKQGTGTRKNANYDHGYETFLLTYVEQLLICPSRYARPCRN